MEPISQLLDSYFNLRRAVLRSLDYEHLSKSEFSQLTGLEGNAKYRRQTNPALWKPVEIYQLAIGLGLRDTTSNQLPKLAQLIDHLSVQEKKAVYKAGSLTAEKLMVRDQNWTTWLPGELEKLQVWCFKASIDYKG